MIRLPLLTAIVIVSYVLFSPILRASTTSEQYFGKCLLKECGRSGPFPTVDLLCTSIRCHLPGALYRRTKNTDGLKEAAIFPLSSDSGRRLTAAILAVRTAEGWHGMTELGNTSASYLAYEFTNLSPDAGDELLLTYKMVGHDFSTTGLVICGMHAGKPYCTRRIPKQYSKTYPTHRHAFQLETHFDPAEGTITFSFTNGSPLKGTPIGDIQPLLGTHKITDLQ